MTLGQVRIALNLSSVQSETYCEIQTIPIDYFVKFDNYGIVLVRYRITALSNSTSRSTFESYDFHNMLDYGTTKL